MGEPGEHTGIRDLTAAEGTVFGVGYTGKAGRSGLFLRLRGARVQRFPFPEGLQPTGVWARTGRDVYVLTREGPVLRFDGETLRRLGGGFPEVRRKLYHAGAPRTLRVVPRQVWARGPNDVWISAEPSVLLHLDGRSWKLVDLGLGSVLVPSPHILGAAVRFPRVGPVWGTGDGALFVRREIIEPFDSAEAKAAIRRRSHPHRELARFGSGLLRRLDGDWQPIDQPMPMCQADRPGRARLPEVRALAPDEIWGRFGAALHRFTNGAWRMVAPLPAYEHGWDQWAACADGKAVVSSYRNEMRMLDGGRWQRIGHPDNTDKEPILHPVLLPGGTLIGVWSRMSSTRIVIRR